MSSQTINISLPKELVKKIDGASKAEFASRSDYIRQSLVAKLKADKEQDWDLLESISAEITQSAESAGYTTDQNFVSAVKKVRQNQLAKAAKK